MWPRLAVKLLTRVGWEFAGRLWVAMRQLWHEITGTLFLALGAATVPTVIREWRGESLVRALVASGFLAAMAYFGITSFLRARKVR